MLLRQVHDETTSFLRPLFGDGRPLLLTVAGALLFSGAFALFLAATGEFLPHDIHYLGMSAADLCGFADCRIVDFMVHDRAAFGGTLLGVGVLYVWLTVFPLTGGEAWAWWVWLVSGVVGFATFLSYIGYGYLDSWHGVGTLLLLPVFVTGMVLTRRTLTAPLEWRQVLRPAGPWDWRGPRTWGRAALLLGAAATAGGGLAILAVGVTVTFVPEDLEFIGLTAARLREINPRLVPLLAHDRAGFGGGVLTMGLTTFLCLWLARPSRHLYQATAVAGTFSLTAALGVHGFVGYTDLGHLAPALGALVLLVCGMILGWPRWRRSGAMPESAHGRPHGP